MTDAPDHDLPSEHDTGADQQLSDPARRALVSLLSQRYVSRARHRLTWDVLLAAESDLRGRLDELFLDLVVDREAEVAFKRQQVGEDVPRLLRRDRPLTRDASFVLLFLVRESSYADPGDGPVVVNRDQISEFLRTFHEQSDGNEARFERRVTAAINALGKPLNLLLPDPDADYLFTISPVVVPLIGPDEVQRLTASFTEATERALVDGNPDDPDGQVGLDGV